MKADRIGYYFGSFDPINQANLEQVIKFRDQFQLKTVFLIPERLSLSDQYTHIVHRTKLINQAIKIHHSLKSYEMTPKILNIQKIITNINHNNSLSIVMIDESLVFEHLEQVSFLKYLSKNDFVINVSSQKQANQLKTMLQDLKIKTPIIWLNKNLNQEFSLKQILKEQSMKDGLLSSSKQYIIDNWLYLKWHDFV